MTRKKLHNLHSICCNVCNRAELWKITQLHSAPQLAKCHSFTSEVMQQFCQLTSVIRHHHSNSASVRGVFYNFVLHHKLILTNRKFAEKIVAVY